MTLQETREIKKTTQLAEMPSSGIQTRDLNSTEEKTLSAAAAIAATDVPGLYDKLAPQRVSTSYNPAREILNLGLKYQDEKTSPALKSLEEETWKWVRQAEMLNNLSAELTGFGDNKTQNLSDAAQKIIKDLQEQGITLLKDSELKTLSKETAKEIREVVGSQQDSLRGKIQQNVMRMQPLLQNQQSIDELMKAISNLHSREGSTFTRNQIPR